MTEPSSGWMSPGGDLPPPTAPGTPTTAPAGTAGPAWQPPSGWGQPGPARAQPGVIPLRPLGLGELLDGAVSLIRRYPRPVLGLSAALAIVGTVLNVVVAVTVFKPLLTLDSRTFSGSGQLDSLDGALGGVAVGGLVSGLVSALTTLVLTGVMTAVAGRAVLGQPMTLGQAWQETRPALGRLLRIALLTAAVVYGAGLAGVALLLVLSAGVGTAGGLVGAPLALGGVALAVYLYCRLSLAPCAAVLERAGVRTSLRRSGILVRRSWWRVFGVLLLALVVASVVTQVVQVPFVVFGIAPIGLGGGGGLVDGATRVLILSYIGAGIAQTVVAPFTAGVRALLYVDRRMRAEGLDVALAAAAQRTA